MDGVAGQIECLQCAVICCQLSQALSAGELVPGQIQQSELEEAMETLCLTDLVVREVHLPQLHTSGQACVNRENNTRHGLSFGTKSTAHWLHHDTEQAKRLTAKRLMA